MKALTLAVLALAIAAACCGTVGIDPTPSNTDAPRLTHTPRPTNTLAATDTPRPTNTPRPTKTPTPTPRFTEEEEEYAAEVVSISNSYADALTRLSDLTDLAARDALYYFNDEDWTNDMAEVLAIILANGVHFRELEPPARFVVFHALYVEAVSHLDNAVLLMIEGIDEFAADKIAAANQELLTGGALLTDASEELDRLMQQ